MVLADGCFDPLHFGHIRYLRAARALGRPLVVRVAPDAAILAKGRTPYQSFHERQQTVLALDMVDQVVGDSTLAEAIRSLKPRYLVKGEDWADRLPEDVLQACQETGTAVAFTQTQERTSTERIGG